MNNKTSGGPVPYAWATRWPGENQLKTQEIKVNTTNQDPRDGGPTRRITPPNFDGTIAYQPPQPKRSRVWVVLIVVAAALVGLCLLGSVVLALVGKKAPERSFSPAADKSASLGTPVRDGKFQFTAKSLTCGVAVPYVTAQGQFCEMDLQVQNIGKEPQTLFDTNQYAYAANGARYQADSAAGLAANAAAQGVWITNINPGNTVEGFVVWDIPKDGKITKVVLHDSAFSGGVSVLVNNAG
jgi:hypothetical protein